MMGSSQKARARTSARVRWSAGVAGRATGGAGRITSWAPPWSWGRAEPAPAGSPYSLRRRSASVGRSVPWVVGSLRRLVDAAVVLGWLGSALFLARLVPQPVRLVAPRRVARRLGPGRPQRHCIRRRLARLRAGSRPGAGVGLRRPGGSARRLDDGAPAPQPARPHGRLRAGLGGRHGHRLARRRCRRPRHRARGQRPRQPGPPGVDGTSGRPARAGSPRRRGSSPSPTPACGAATACWCATPRSSPTAPSWSTSSVIVLVRLAQVGGWAALRPGLPAGLVDSFPDPIEPL